MWFCGGIFKGVWVLSDFSKVDENFKMKGCGTSFWRLCTRRGDLKEGV